MSEKEIEQEIQNKGLTAPRITPEIIDGVIVSEQYHVFAGSMLTVCALTLENGFHVVGESACASPENFNAEIGRKIARENARNKIWQLEGYLLRSRLKGNTK
ncbi:Gp49 family protein [uncultured Kiloniella sp.]|uniref:Gp49 family protein n=1 Tax=uncultured Kiloniella sp. TaxID=1133091 RepID=UPI0026385D14|nr:Gp49 family protein [uncultured Kiloniella sp.]